MSPPGAARPLPSDQFPMRSFLSSSSVSGQSTGQFPQVRSSQVWQASELVSHVRYRPPTSPSLTLKITASTLQCRQCTVRTCVPTGGPPGHSRRIAAFTQCPPQTSQACHDTAVLPPLVDDVAEIVYRLGCHSACTLSLSRIHLGLPAGAANRYDQPSDPLQPLRAGLPVHQVEKRLPKGIRIGPERQDIENLLGRNPDGQRLQAGPHR